MRNHIVAIAGPKDKFANSFKKSDNVIIVPFGIEGHQDAADISMYDFLAEHQMEVDPLADEFFQFALSAYTGDVRVSRSLAFDGWTREFHLWMPVRNQRKWNAVKTHLENLLGFLTGDHWSIYFRERDDSYVTPEPEQKSLGIPISADVVSLFSGGLDSYIGAIDLIAKNKKPLLVGHHSLGGGPTSVAQKIAISALNKKSNIDTPFFRLWVSPKKGKFRASEITTRGRSILFIALGVVCSKAANSTKLYIPENGFISLNVPLTASRSGSFSTRTTHPYYIWLLQEVFNYLKIGVDLILPYKFKTKGEMIEECLDQDKVNLALKVTMSCSHPGVNRWVSGGNPNAHCGYCVPCIIRKGAIIRSRKDPTKYSYKLNKNLSESRSQDYRTFKMAIDRMRTEGPSLLDILSSGPIPGDNIIKQSHFDVYRRGIEEAAKVLKV
ncbi:MAG: hypothetical protein JNM24_06665 [Bdellovibrionaceae bacterium]|nr:hypothetical protein [Pseudobdellovibrionaceae bacterium]